MSQYVKREPWPFHIKIDGRGYMIGSQGANQPALVSAKAQDISAVSPPSYEYAGLNPLHEREQPYESLVLGMGMKVQEEWQDFRYAHALGVDCSVWPWCRGPELVATTGEPAGQVVDFFELGGNLYVAIGSSIARLDVGTRGWTTTRVFPQNILAATVFTSNFDGIPRVWVALQGAPAQYSSDGTNFTAMPTFQSLGFAAVGREWWWADDVNRLRKVDTDADPTLEANYTSLQFRVGDRSAPITALIVTAAGTLIVAKTDGLYTLDEAGDQRALFPFLQYAPVANNGKAWGQFLDDVYVAYGTSFSRLNPDLSLESVGPERLVNNDSPVRGTITAFAGLDTKFAYAGIYNTDTFIGYLLKFGGYRVKEGETERLDAWHGALASWSGAYPTKLFVSAIGAPAGHTRTYVGLTSGTVEYMVNPCVPNPAACSQYRFAIGSGYVEMPLWHGGYHASNKSVRHLAISSTFLNSLNYATVEYSLTPTGALIDSGEVFDAPVYHQTTLPTDATTVLARFRVVLHNTANTASPLVSAFSVGHALRPMRVMTFEADILCADGLVRRDGVQMRMGRQMIRQFIEQAVDAPGAVRVVLPDETTQDLSFTNYRISQAFDEVGRQWRGALRITATQWTTAEVPA